MNTIFSSNFSSSLKSMIEYKKTIGYSENTYLPYCKNFDRYCFKNYPKDEYLTKDIVLDWISASECKSGRIIQARAGFIRGFGKYLSNIGINTYVLPNKFNGIKQKFSPYIFTDDELSSLFKTIDKSKNSRNSFQGLVFSTIFRLIYTCGLRPREARLLKRTTINLNTGEILITQTKNHKERIVVMSDDMLSLAKKYSYLRDLEYQNCEWFFPLSHDNPYSEALLQRWFKKFFIDSKSQIDPDILPIVRVYDLRHRFASAVLSKWLSEKVDLNSKLPYLSTYMGHSSLSATAYYIHILPENLMKSSGIDWNYMQKILPEVTLWED